MRTIDRSFQRRAFSLVELLVVIGIIAVLIGILIPVINKSRQAGYKVVCASNLRQIGAGMETYATTYNEFPRIIYDVQCWGGNPDPVHWNDPKAFSGAGCVDPFNTAFGLTTTIAGSTTTRPQDQDVTAAMFLMVRYGMLTTKVFVCPADSDAYADTMAGLPAIKRCNFSARKNLSYSIYTCYPLGSAKVTYGWGGYYGSDMRADMPLLADLNPGDQGTPRPYALTLTSSSNDVRQGNSRNHNMSGQNVYYKDGHVEWTSTPFCGINQDNIYTRAYRGGATIPTADQQSDPTDPFGSLPPSHIADAVLLPTGTADSAPSGDANAIHISAF